MKYLWIFASLVGGYIALVAIIELFVWRLQPNYDNSLTITTTGADGTSKTRKLARFEYEGKLYVSSNHWFRSWYRQALANPTVNVEYDGRSKPMRALPVTGDQQAELSRNYNMGFVLRLLCGFAPSRFLQLNPDV